MRDSRFRRQGMMKNRMFFLFECSVCGQDELPLTDKNEHKPGLRDSRALKTRAYVYVDGLCSRG